MANDNRDGEKVAGSCFCGVVKFSITLPTLFCGHCHCSMCRRPHGAAYVTWTGVPPDQFQILEGEEHLKKYRSSKEGTRSFCGTCGSQLFCQTEPHEIDVALASLHGEIDREPNVHWHYNSKASWTHINDDLPKKDGHE